MGRLAAFLLIAAVVVFVLFEAGIVPAWAAGMDTVLDERFDTLDASLWDVSYWHLGNRSTGITTLSGGVLAMRPTRTRGVCSLETSRVIVTRLPARVTFRVRYTYPTYRGAAFGLGGVRDSSHAFDPAQGIWWGLGTTHHMYAPAERGLFVRACDGSAQAFYPAAGNMPVIPSDVWLDGELLLNAGGFEARFNDQVITGAADLKALVQGTGGLRPGFVTGDDYSRRGFDIDQVVVEQAQSVVAVGLDITPGRLNARSRGRWVSAWVLSNADADVSGADPATVKVTSVNGSPADIPAALSPAAVGDHDADGRLDRMVKISRTALMALMVPGNNTVTVSGSLPDGTEFEGSDTVVLIRPRAGRAHGGAARSRGRRR